DEQYTYRVDVPIPTGETAKPRLIAIPDGWVMGGFFLAPPLAFVDCDTLLTTCHRYDYEMSERVVSTLDGSVILAFAVSRSEVGVWRRQESGEYVLDAEPIVAT